jgi:hypothetical protein
MHEPSSIVTLCERKRLRGTEGRVPSPRVARDMERRRSRSVVAAPHNGAMGEDGAGALDAAADELYGLAPERFTARRGELAKAARAAGDKSAATEISALRKPTVPAWLVNLLAREASDELGGLLQLGEQLREAQSQLVGPRIKELSQQAHAAVQGLSRRVAELAESRDQAVTPAVDRDVEQTLRAALADPQAEWVTGAVVAVDGGRVLGPPECR